MIGWGGFSPWTIWVGELFQGFEGRSGIRPYLVHGFKAGAKAAGGSHEPQMLLVPMRYHLLGLRAFHELS